MRFFLKNTSKVVWFFSIFISLCSSAYADPSTLIASSVAGAIGYSLNPINWAIGAIGGGAGKLMSLSIAKFVSKELPIGFGIGMGVGIAQAYVNSYDHQLGIVNWTDFLAQTIDAGIQGLIGSLIFLWLRKSYRKMKTINLPV